MSARQQDILFTDFAAWGFNEHGWSRRTQAAYRERAANADDWLRRNRNSGLLWCTTDDIKAYLFSRSPNARTRNAIRAALVAFGAYAVERGLSRQNASAALPRLPEPASIPKALSVEQARAIELVAAGRDLMTRALILTYLYGGLRCNEARLLEWSSVDLDGGWFRILGKGRGGRSKQRDVPIHPTVAAALRHWRGSSEEGRWVFPSPRLSGRPISESWIQRTIQRAGDDVGVALHSHVLRHTAATRLLDTGADLRDVQVFLGHASPVTTAIYTKVRPVRIKEAVGRMDYRILD